MLPKSGREKIISFLLGRGNRAEGLHRISEGTGSNWIMQPHTPSTQAHIPLPTVLSVNRRMKED